MFPALTEAVTEFVRTMSDELSALSGKPAEQHLADAAVEAADIVGSLLAADGRFTDGELEAYLDSVGPLLNPPLLVSSIKLREMDLFRGKESWLTAPSVLFDLLSRADARPGAAGAVVARRSHRYYELALRVAHLTAAVDLVPSPDEVAAIDRFRTTMLQAMDAAGIERPGQPPVVPAGPATPNGPAAAPGRPTPASTSAARAGRRSPGATAGSFDRRPPR
jgi:hypothetical protein